MILITFKSNREDREKGKTYNWGMKGPKLIIVITPSDWTNKSTST